MFLNGVLVPDFPLTCQVASDGEVEQIGEGSLFHNTCIIFPLVTIRVSVLADHLPLSQGSATEAVTRFNGTQSALLYLRRGWRNRQAWGRRMGRGLGRVGSNPASGRHSLS
jgi:hypothetical protein